MSVFFSRLFKEAICEKKLRHADVVKLLQTYDYEAFKGLDCVTVNRWVHGITVPKFYKILLASAALGLDITKIIFLKIRSESRVKLSKEQDDFYRQLDSMLFYVGYFSHDHPLTTKSLSLSKNEHNSLYGTFYSNFPALLNLSIKLEKMGVDYNINSIVSKKDNVTLGHLSYILDATSYHIPDVDFSFKINGNQMFILPGYYANSVVFTQIIKEFFMSYVLNNTYTRKRFGVFFVHNSNSLKFFEKVFKAKVLKCFLNPKNANHEAITLYALEVDLLYALSSSFVLDLVANEKSTSTEDFNTYRQLKNAN